MDFVFLSTQGWQEMGGAGRPIHYLARELLARGQRVLFVEVVTSGEPHGDTQFTLLNFNALGFDERALRRAWFGLDPRVEFTAAFARVLDAFHAPSAERVVVYSDPFVPFVSLFPLFRARGYRIVYDALDDFSAFPDIGLYFTNDAAERFLVAHSDLTVAVSTTLVEKLAAWAPPAPVRLLRQGFDPATFRAPTAAAPVGGGNPARSPECVCGFWGHVNSFNIDVELVEHVARARPAWTIQLIGPVDRDPSLPPVGARLRALPNVQLIGQVPHAGLPRYLQAFDVALAPFPDNAFNRARDPLKVYEYASGYKPIVAAHTPQLAAMPYLTVANTPQEFLDGIEHARKTIVDRAVVDNYLRECTWSSRLDQLLAWLEPITPAPTSPAPEISRWYADASLTPNLAHYIARTEQLLDERTTYARALETDAQVKQAHIDQLEQSNPLWQLKKYIAR